MRVVAHLRGGKLVKGYTDVFPADDLEKLLQEAPLALPEKLPIRGAATREVQSVSVAALKALFFVRSFEGRNQYDEIKFFENHPPVQGLWVRLKYYDGEASEGVVHNSLHHLVNPGFYLKPPDPASNNRFIYVLKSALSDFRVLGVRSTY